ncbi:MAG: RNA polymerase sigma factor [Aristaeellaceae bacterium]
MEANSRSAALTRMLGQYQQSLLTMCYAYLHDRQLAEDAMQETFLRAYRALGTFLGACSEKTWLTAIAVNVCRSMRCKAWFTHENCSVTPEELPLTVGGGYDQSAADLAAAIQRLPDKLKEAVLLYCYQELSMTEIAGIVGVLPSVVSRRIGKAHARLQGLLGKAYLHG